MSRSHRVWNDIQADNYVTSKSFGGEFRQRIAVGSSAAYSNYFASIEVSELPVQGNWSVFTLYIDGEPVKRAVFHNKTKAFHPLGLNSDADNFVIGLES